MKTLETTKKLTAISMAILFIATSTFAAPANMTTWVFRSGGFSVAMPGEPEYKELRREGATSVHAWTLLTDDGHFYLVSYADESNLDLSVQLSGYVDGLRGRIVNSGAFKVEGHAAEYRVFESDQGKFYAYATSVGNRLFIYSYGTTYKTPIPAEAQEFVDSFKLL